MTRSVRLYGSGYATMILYPLETARENSCRPWPPMLILAARVSRMFSIKACQTCILMRIISSRCSAFPEPWFQLASTLSTSWRQITATMIQTWLELCCNRLRTHPEDASQDLGTQASAKIWNLRSGQTNLILSATARIAKSMEHPDLVANGATAQVAMTVNCILSVYHAIPAILRLRQKLTPGLNAIARSRPPLKSSWIIAATRTCLLTKERDCPSASQSVRSSQIQKDVV